VDGVDTLQIVVEVPWGWDEVTHENGLELTKKHGSHGAMWWREFRGVNDERFVYKGCSPYSGWLVWEGSAPKALGLERPADSGDIGRLLRTLADSYAGFGMPRFSRVDLVSDSLDPDRQLLDLAVGWRPHARSRYVEAVYQGGQTVFLHNKSRGIRIYDKHEESGSEAYRDVVRVEYQLRRRWAERLGFRSGLCGDWDERVSGVMGELTSALREGRESEV